MRRREFIAGLGSAAAWPAAAAWAQRVPVIGYLSPEEPTDSFVDGLRSGLRERGYVEGQNIRIEYRWARGKFEQLPNLAAELVRLNVDVIVAFVTQASLAAQKATSTIPIVMLAVADPVGVGLIASLSRPGGNITGTSSISVDLVGKRFELLRQVVPTASHIAALWNPANAAFQELQLREAKLAARMIGIELQLLEVRAPHEFDAAFAAIDRERPRALLIPEDPLFFSHISKLVELVRSRHLAAVYGGRIFPEAGGLMSYGPNYYDLSKLCATYVDTILKGAKPADLPVEQPTRFEFVVNLRAAREFGFDLPASILLRADEVIE